MTKPKKQNSADKAEQLFERMLRMTGKLQKLAREARANGRVSEAQTLETLLRETLAISNSVQSISSELREGGKTDEQQDRDSDKPASNVRTKPSGSQQQRPRLSA
jgi:hypothetical protein